MMSQEEAEAAINLDEPVQVLDHGFVRLIDWMGTDLSVVRAARVSYDAAWRSGEDSGSDARLIKYLWGHGHTSPFEAVTFTFEVKAPIFVFRQWHRHRTWGFNELSARYRELLEEFYVPSPDQIGVQAKDTKQARDMSAESSWNNHASTVIRETCQTSFGVYRQLLSYGVPRELARSVLPVATYSHMFATVNLLNLFRFLKLRLDAHAQYEIRVYADAMLELVRPVVPISVKAFQEGIDRL